MSGFDENVKNPIFDTRSPLIPILGFFSKFQPCHFLYFIDLQLHAKFKKKLMSSLQDIWTYRQTDRPLTDKGDY